MRGLPLLGLAVGSLLLLPPGRADDPPSPDDELLKSHKVEPDGPGLLKYLRDRTLDDAGVRRAERLVRELGDDDFDVRQGAQKDLIALGVRARPFLLKGTKDPDLEIVKRSYQCLRAIAKGVPESVRLSTAAVRAVARHKPDGVAAALLAFLPCAEDDAVAEEVRLALVPLAVRGGKPDPAVVAGLADRLAVKRGAAAAALCRAGVKAQLPAVRKLLRDPDASVRLAVAVALAAYREKDAVPVLIALLDKGSVKETKLAEELLYRLADDGAPPLPDGDGAGARRKYREAWEGWWKKHGAKLDLARLEAVAGTLGATLVLMMDDGVVRELDASNRVRWEFGGLRKPLDVQRLPGDRVLVAEFDAGRVTERSVKGEVLWEKKLVGPLAAQRLANGHTFVATRTELYEFDKGGKEVWNYSRPGGEHIMRARKLANGDVALIVQLGVSWYVRLDKDGKQLKKLAVEVYTSGGRVDVLPDGCVLVPEHRNNRVVVLDGGGKVVRSLAVPQPIMATYLPNGHVLVTSMSQNRAVEFDRAGKEVWQYRQDTRVTRAVRP